MKAALFDVLSFVLLVCSLACLVFTVQMAAAQRDLDARSKAELRVMMRDMDAYLAAADRDDRQEMRRIYLKYNPPHAVRPIGH